MNQPNPPQTVTAPPAGRERAKFSMLITFTYNAARARSKKSQTYRDDITILQFENRGISVRGLHEIEVLYRKYLEEKLSVFSMMIFDNRKARGNDVVYKVIITNGVERVFEDFRDRYFDLRTGKPNSG